MKDPIAEEEQFLVFHISIHGCQFLKAAPPGFTRSTSSKNGNLDDKGKSRGDDIEVHHHDSLVTAKIDEKDQIIAICDEDLNTWIEPVS